MLIAATHPYEMPDGGQSIASALVAMNAEDGAVLWRAELEGRPTPACVAQGRVLVGSSSGGVLAFDARDGGLDWEYRTKDAVLGQPVVVDGVVYFGGGGDRSLHAVELASGKKKWVRKVKGEGVFSPLRIEGDLLFAFSAGHHAAPMLYGYGARGSKRLWQENKLEITQLTGPNDFEVSGGLLFAGVTPNRYRTKEDVTEGGEPTNYVLALAAEDGEESWRTKTGPLACYGPTVSGEVLVCHAIDPSAGAGPSAGELYLVAFSTASGEELWREKLGRTHMRWGYTAPSVSGGVVYAASADKVMAFELQQGRSVWEQPRRGAVIAVARGLVYTAAAGGGVAVLDVRGGRPRWDATLQIAMEGAPGPACPGEISPLSIAD